MRVLIVTTQVPFIRGGAEAHAEGLRDALIRKRHDAEIVSIPFKWYPPEKILDHMLACRLLDLTEVAGTPVDILIGLKFPAYLVRHPNKVLWILHQFRTAYDLWNHPLGDLIYSPDGQEVRDAIIKADRELIPEAKAVFANSSNVAARLKRFCGIAAIPLYHPPPNAELFYAASAEDYLFFPSRLCLPKRQSLIVEALARTSNRVNVRFAGAPDQKGYGAELKTLAGKCGVADRVQWLGYITEEEKRHLYGHALGIIYPPIDEDLGYVTLEAMLASKPVISCSDSGGPLELIRHRETGLVVEATAQDVAVAMDELWENRGLAKTWGEAGRQLYESMNISWSGVLKALLG